MSKLLAHFHPLGWIAMIFLWPLAAEAQALDTNAVLNAWFAAQASLRTWQADFTQIRNLKALSQPLATPGKIWVALPDRFRWELGAPAQTIALRQPARMFVIYPRLKRAEKYPLTASAQGPWKDALVLLESGFPRNRQELESRFKLLSLVQTNAVFQLLLQPKSASARQFISEIGVSLKTNDFSLIANSVTTGDGSTLRNDYTNAVVNPALGEEIFAVNLAPDFKVVEPMRP